MTWGSHSVPGCHDPSPYVSHYQRATLHDFGNLHGRPCGRRLQEPFSAEVTTCLFCGLMLERTWGKHVEIGEIWSQNGWFIYDIYVYILEIPMNIWIIILEVFSIIGNLKIEYTWISYPIVSTEDWVLKSIWDMFKAYILRPMPFVLCLV